MTILIESPVEDVIVELEKLIESLRAGKIRCVSMHKMKTAERVPTPDGSQAYVLVHSTDISFSGEV